MGLTNLITVIPPDVEETPEDIFSAAPGFLYPDDLRNQHGDDGSVLIYHSTAFGNIELTIAEPESENDRKLFAHYLWNAGIKMAELISGTNSKWNVTHERVVELGAGVGLGGIVAALAGAREVVITDYPAPALLRNIRRNAEKALSSDRSAQYSVEGYEWGDDTSSFAKANAHSFTRVIAADCFWMPHEHENLVKAMLHLLDFSQDSRILATAGFHTGRAKLASFFDEAISQGLEIEEIFEEDAEGRLREWAKERDGGTENVTERKKWLVVSILRRRGAS